MLARLKPLTRLVMTNTTMEAEKDILQTSFVGIGDSR